MASMNFGCELVCADTRPQSLMKRRPSTGEFDSEPAKCRYNSKVLVADWFEKRSKYETPKDDWHTVYDETYTCKSNNYLVQDRTDSRNIKIRAEQGLGAELLINHHGDSFHGNYTTTNDLLFRVLPQGLCGPQTRAYSSRKDKWLPEIDLTKNFGNLTNYNDDRYCKMLEEATKPVKRFVKPKGITNEPYLCHLDINPDLPFRPHLIKIKN